MHSWKTRSWESKFLAARLSTPSLETWFENSVATWNRTGCKIRRSITTSRRSPLAMKTTGTAALLLILPTLVLVGCQTSRKGGNRAWAYIPTPGLETLSGFPAEIALPTRRYGTNRIEVFVGGEVVSPGIVRAPVGCTVLQAVGHAGGFTPFAFAPRLRLIEATGRSYRLTLRRKRAGLFGHRIVWYAPEGSRGAFVTERTSRTPSDTDYPLDHGDQIYALRVYGE